MSAYTVFVFSALVLSASSFLIKVPTVVQPSKTAPVQAGWLKMQKMIIPFFDNVCEESAYPEILAAANEFEVIIVKNTNFINNGSSIQFMDGDVVDNLQKLLSTKGLTPKGEIFSEYNDEHMNELKLLRDILCSAKNFDSFYRAAAWAHQNVNCGLFIDAIYFSILNRRETNLLSIPAPYEILPNYFIRKDFIAKAASLMADEDPSIYEGIRNEGISYIIDANYTADYYNNADESVLAYFHEDIGLNSYYFLRKLKSALWLNTPTNPNSNYGEFLYFTMQQLAARYDLERYSNGIPELDEISWNNLKILPYDSMLIYSNGDDFASRPYETDIVGNDHTDVALLEEVEENISNYITQLMKYVQSKTGIDRKQIINHLMEILITNDKSYNALARKILKSYNVNGKQSSLEHYMTSLRDPMFWVLNKKIVKLVEKSLEVLPKYTKKELYFPGIEILNVEAKKLMTTCDSFEFDITDALKTNTSKTPFQVKIGQQRLSNKPFTIKITVDSRLKQRGFVKIFLGPRISPGELYKKKNSFMLLDCFETIFKLGTNVISRSSDSMTNLSNDFETLRTIRKKVLDAEFGLYTSPTNTIEKQIRFPSRLIIPKGSSEGLPFQLFVFITPYAISLDPTSNADLLAEIISSPGYPLDLSMDDSTILELPNAMIKDVVITHKGEGKTSNINGNGAESNKWNSGYTYETSQQSRPSYGKREPFDYKSKRGEYDTKNDFNNDKTSYMIKDDSKKLYDQLQEIDSLQKEQHDTEEKTQVISSNTAKRDSRLLKLAFDDGNSSGNREPSKKREAFDYKAKKEENEKKRKAYKNIDIFTKKNLTPEDITTDMNNGPNVPPDNEIVHDESNEDVDISLRVIPFLKSAQNKMYSFILHTLFSDAEKIYI